MSIRLLGLFIIGLVLSLTCVPAVNNSSVIINTSVNDSDVNSSNNNIFNDSFNNSNSSNQTNETIVVDPYKDLGFIKLNGTESDFDYVPSSNLEWNRIHTDTMPKFRDDIDNLKAVMDFNAKHADELYSKGVISYDSGSNGKFRHVPITVDKDMFYYDAKFDSYKDIILSFLDVFNGLMFPLTMAFSGITTVAGAVFGIISICVGVTGLAAPAAGPQGAAIPVAVSTTGGSVLKVISGIVGIIGASATITFGIISAIIADDKSKTSDVWKSYSTNHGELKLEVPYLNTVSSVQTTDCVVSNVTVNSTLNDTNSTVNDTNSTNRSVIPVVNNTSNVTIVKLQISNDNSLGEPILPNSEPINNIKLDVPSITPLLSFEPIKQWGNWMSWDHPDYAPRNYKIDGSSWRKVKWYCAWNAIINAGVAIVLALWWVTYTIAYGVSYAAYCFYFITYNLYVMGSLIADIPKLITLFAFMEDCSKVKVPDMSVKNINITNEKTKEYCLHNL